MKVKLKTYFMRKKRQEEQAEKEFEEKRLRHEKERKENLIELNKLKEQVLTLEKELSEYREIKVQLVKELDVINKQLEVEKMKEVDYNRNIQAMKENTQEIKEKAEEDKKCLGYDHEAASQNIVNNALLLHIPKAFPKNPVKTTATDSVLPAILSNRNRKAALQNFYPSPLYADVFRSESESNTPANLPLSTVNRKPLSKTILIMNISSYSCLYRK